METRKLSGKHRWTNILHISQRIGIIVIVAATKYNPNCTPSNIKNIWTWQSQTDEISTIFGCSDEGPTQPGHPVLSKGASKATAADDQIRWALAKFEKRWVYLKMNYPGHPWISQIYSPFNGNFEGPIFRPGCAPGFKLHPARFRVSKQFPPQDLEKSSTRISLVRFCIMILRHEGCLFRKNPSIQRMRLIFNGKYDNVACRIWKIWRLKLKFRY